jgi:excisionase family DNA binding protein
MSTANPHITSHQAADLLLVRRATVTEYLRKGWLRGRRIGRGWRIEASSVETLLKCGPPASVGHIS